MSSHYARGDTVLFQGSVAASSVGYWASSRIPYAFVIDTVLVSWVIGTQRTLQIYILTAGDNNLPASGIPSGTNVIGGLGNSRYLVGDTQATEYPVYARVDTPGSFIKIYANNTDASAHTVDVMARLFRLEDVEPHDHRGR